jgi:helicase MOV-10
VELNQVLLRFHNSFKAFKGQLFEVSFNLSRSSLRRMHQALLIAWKPERILFPSEEHIAGAYPPTADEIDGLRLYNRYMEGNPAQKLAVASILSQPPGSVPFVIFGP